MKRNLLLIDGHNFLFKAYGVPFKFHSSTGTPLQVNTTFLSMVRRTVRALDEHGSCTSLAIVFDSELPSSNHLLSATYKATRKIDYSQDEDSPFHHFPNIRKALKYLKIKTYETKGIEADDIIASLSAQFLKDHRNGHVYIASNDSDFYQLISPKVTQLVLGKKGTHTFLLPRDIKIKLGVTPKQYVYFKSLVGDKADNIAGIPNVGPVRALKIISKEIKMDLTSHRTLLEMNKKLITLNCDMTICKNWEPLTKFSKLLQLKNQEIFLKLGF
jgi:DNA polymerase I